ncbi:hypothetical protein MMC11_005070 [Xylographa trunciseda]|nr:hypothetical protein [Xylographa trunciseda]
MEEGNNVWPEQIDKAVSLPRPDDLHDALKWSLLRKYKITAVLCLAAFIGLSSPLSGQLNLAQQAKLYEKSALQVSYSNSAAIAGIAFGGFFFAPVAHILGRCSVIFWALIGCLVCQIWASFMTHSDQYNAYIVSRLFAGIFGGVPSVLGPGLLMDLYPLTQHGRAFNIFHSSLLLGTIAGPTISAFISANNVWTVEYWWTVAFLAFTIVLTFLVLEETGSDRVSNMSKTRIPNSFLHNRAATFFFGTKVVPHTTIKRTLRVAALPVLIGLCPVTVLMGTFTLVSFGFYIAMNALTPVWLQNPREASGYGFTIQQNAAFTFFHWLGLLLALVYGHALNDYLPLALSARRNTWKPEYRLHSLWIVVCMPIGLGLFGAALRYHLSWGVLAVGWVLVTVGSLSVVPVAVNYICECFPDYPAEVGIVMGAYRLGFGLTISFFINPWVGAVDVGWAYGMMACLTVATFSFVLLLAWKGEALRRWQPFGLREN